MDAQVRETHSAVVVLVGDRVYKVKKPVRLAFLDFSTVESRRRIAETEVALNRRLAPDVYLGVGSWHAPPGEPGPGEPEPIVVMRRMPDDRRLATMVTEGRVTVDDLRGVARVVAAFHARAARSPVIERAGLPETVSTKFETDVAETLDVAVGVLDPGRVEEVARLGRRYLAGRRPLLDERVRAGMICDGHGDLLADDIFCLDDGPRILDCIEFDDRLRHGDVLADVAFLAMDLERLGSPSLARAFLDAYVAFSGERHPESLAHFYIAARALIRTKVTAVRVHQGDHASAPLAASLLALADAHLRQGRVTCTLVGGLPGAGKSTLARAIAPLLDATVLSSDEVRKELAGMPHDARAAAPYGEGIYDDAHTAATYDELCARARHLLARGVSVVLDASWTRAAHRELARAVAAETHSDLAALVCVAPPEVRAARMAGRATDPRRVSDATPAIADTMAAAADPWPEAVAVSTAQGVERSVAAARRALGTSEPDPAGTGPGIRRSRRRPGR